MTTLKVRSPMPTLCLLFAGSVAAALSLAASAKGKPGTIQVPSFELPPSNYLSGRARDDLTQWSVRKTGPSCPSVFNASNITVTAIKATRRCLAKEEKPVRRRFLARFAVTISEEKIAGVPSVIFTPKAGVTAGNSGKVLINLHGGASIVGDPWLESIPIAAVARMKVIGIEYRMAPEYKFPAASEDVAAVYRALLRDHARNNIGIYGCSSGGKLTAQAVAWFQAHGLPRPGAIGLFGTGAESYVDGDSAHFAAAEVGIDMFGDGIKALEEAYYGKHPDFKNPLVSPLSSTAVLARFPPTLLISSTRDWGLSNAVYTHTKLVKLGVPADLHVWEGLGHCFFVADPDTPEARDVYDVIARFFTTRLGARH